ANGTVYPPLTGGMPIVLDGERAHFPGGTYATAPYIALPPGIISSMGNVTIEMWVGEAVKQYRTWFFGAGTTVSDPRLVPSAGNANPVLEVADEVSGSPLGTSFPPYFHVPWRNYFPEFWEYGLQ